MDVFKKIDAAVMKVLKIISCVSPAVLIIMALLATVNVLTSKILVIPIPGNIKWISYLLVVVIYFAIPHEQLYRGFLSVDVFSVKYPKAIRVILNILSDLLGILVFGLISYAGISQFQTDFQYKTLSEAGSGGFVLWPFDLTVVVMTGLLCVTFLWNIIRLAAYKGDVPRLARKEDD